MSCPVVSPPPCGVGVGVVVGVGVGAHSVVSALTHGSGVGVGSHPSLSEIMQGSGIAVGVGSQPMRSAIMQGSIVGEGEGAQSAAPLEQGSESELATSTESCCGGFTSFSENFSFNPPSCSHNSLKLSSM